MDPDCRVDLPTGVALQDLDAFRTQLVAIFVMFFYTRKVLCHRPSRLGPRDVQGIISRTFGAECSQTMTNGPNDVSFTLFARWQRRMIEFDPSQSQGRIVSVLFLAIL